MSEGEIKSSPYASPMYNYGSSILVMTNPEEELIKMELTFRSQIQDSEGKVRQVGEPLMNELGINSVVGIVQSVVNRITVMSNLNKFDVPMMVDFLGDTVAKDLMINRVKYEIKTATARDKIYFTALTTAFMTMKRAYEEGEKRFWKGSQQEITTRVQSNNDKKSVFGNMMGWNK